MTQRIETEAERQDRDRIQHQQIRTEQSAAETLEAQRHSRETATRRDDSEATHPEWISPHAKEASGHYILAIGLIAVFIGDVILSSPTSEYIAVRYLGGAALVVASARVWFPGIILLIELAIGLQRFRAAEAALLDTKKRVAAWIWNGVAIALTLVMPVLVAATQIASWPEVTTDELRASLQLRLFALVTLALILHAAVIFGGRPLHEAKSFVLFRIRLGIQRARARAAQKRLDQSRAELSSSFSALRRAVTAHRARYPGSTVQAGPFNRSTLELLEETFTPEVLHATEESAHRPDFGDVGTPDPVGA